MLEKLITNTNVWRIGRSISYMNVPPTMISLVSIEGNIGAGKSTYMKQLREKYSNRPEIHFIDEPLAMWSSIKNDDGLNLLETYYSG